MVELGFGPRAWSLSPFPPSQLSRLVLALVCLSGDVWSRVFQAWLQTTSVYLIMIVRVAFHQSPMCGVPCEVSVRHTRVGLGVFASPQSTQIPGFKGKEWKHRRGLKVKQLIQWLSQKLNLGSLAPEYGPVII